jgi:hypothetical protein
MNAPMLNGPSTVIRRHPVTLRTGLHRAILNQLGITPAELEE